MQKLFPSLFLFTHRRGAAIAFIKTEQARQEAERLLQNENWLPHIKKNNTIEFLTNEHFNLYRMIAKTAENLHPLFSFVLKENSILVSEIQSLFVGIGPGSFTGLRLGCAFANGLKLGSSLTIFELKSLLISDIVNKMQSYSKLLLNELFRELENHDSNDESTGYVTFFDLIFALTDSQLGANSFWHLNCSVDSLNPKYGREPSPVLKLKQEKS